MPEEYIPFESKHGITILMPKDKRKPAKYMVCVPEVITLEQLTALADTIYTLTGTKEEPKPEPKKKPAEKDKGVVAVSLCKSCKNEECNVKQGKGKEVPAGIPCDQFKE